MDIEISLRGLRPGEPESDREIERAIAMLRTVAPEPVLGDSTLGPLDQCAPALDDSVLGELRESAAMTLTGLRADELAQARRDGVAENSVSALLDWATSNGIDPVRRAEVTRASRRERAREVIDGYIRQRMTTSLSAVARHTNGILHALDAAGLL